MYKSVGALFSFIENCEGPLGLIDWKSCFLYRRKVIIYGRLQYSAQSGLIFEDSIEILI